MCTAARADREIGCVLVLEAQNSKFKAQKKSQVPSFKLQGALQPLLFPYSSSDSAQAFDGQTRMRVYFCSPPPLKAANRLNVRRTMHLTRTSIAVLLALAALTASARLITSTRLDPKIVTA